MSAQASSLCWRLALQCAVFPAQVVVAFEKLRLRVKRRSALGEAACLAMQWHDVLAHRSVQAFQQRSRDLFERNQFFNTKDHAASHREQTPPNSLFDNLPVAQARIRHDLRFFRTATSLAFDEVDQHRVDQCERKPVGLPTVAGPQRPAISGEPSGCAFNQFRGRLLRTWADHHFEHQAGFTRHCEVRPVLPDLLKIVFFVRLLSTRKAVEFIQFDIFRDDVGEDFPVGGLRLGASTLNPTLNAGRMNLFNARDRLRTQPFESLLNGAQDFLFGSLEVIEGRAGTVAKGFPTLPTTNDKDSLAAPQGVAAMIG